ncbi:hypothetical protein, partial [Helicobacter muridarum]
YIYIYITNVIPLFLYLQHIYNQSQSNNPSKSKKSKSIVLTKLYLYIANRKILKSSIAKYRLMQRICIYLGYKCFTPPPHSNFKSLGSKQCNFTLSISI